MIDAPAFKPQLFSGEHILWSGRPKQGLIFYSRDALLIPFSLMWGGFAIFWNVSVWRMSSGQNSGGPDIFFKLWDLPFLAAGLYMIVGRFLHDAYVRRHILYAVTNQRILILSRGKTTSLEFDRLPRLDLTEHGDGTGTLGFETSPAISWGGMNGFSWWIPSIEPTAKFLRIRDAQNVYGLVRDRTRTMG